MKRFLYILLLLISFQTINAQIQFEAKVSKTTLGLNETLRVDFSMNADGDNFSIPNFEGFRVVGGPSQQISQSWINGRSSFNKAYSYYLLPLQKGVLTIKSAKIEINGQIYKTNPINITVTNAIPKPRDPNQQAQLSADTELHLIADISNTNPYINQPVTVVYKLYFSNNVGISNFDETNKPKYKDFWSQNIEIKELIPEQTTYKGEPYRSIILKKVILYPQKSGALVIEPLSLNIDVQLPTGRRDIFGQMQIVEDSKVVSAGNKTLNVKPLPEIGKPEGFTGAAGKFDFTVTPSKTSLKHGESLTLLVKAQGTGNLKLFSLPKPIVPNALEMFDPEHQENITTPLSGDQGSISDNYTIVPQYKGKYLIKPLVFSYFDFSSRSYKTITSKEILIDVIDGPTESIANNNINKSKNVKANKKLVFQDIKLKTVFSNIKKRDFLYSNKFYVLMLLPFFMIPLIVFIKRQKENLDSDTVGNRLKMNNRLAKKYLSKAKKHQ